MLITDLLKQEFRKGFRSQTFYRRLVVKLLMGFMALYFAVIFLMIGLFLGDMLDEVHDVLTPLELINGASIYIVLAALIIRFFMQTLNTLNLPAYQSLPIKRNTLINFILIRPVFSAANYMTLLVIIPFAIKSITQWYSGAVAFQFVLNCTLLIWMNSWLASYLKRRFGSSLTTVIVLLVLVAGITALEFFKLFSFFDVSLKVFGFLTMKPFGWLTTLALAGSAYGLNYMFFSKNFYPEKFDQKLKRNENKIRGGFSFLEKYGTIGELIQLQTRLIFRHKRTKSLVFMSCFFLLYGMLFYKNPTYGDSTAWLVFCGLIITGMASMMYGQYIMGWESNYFDMILTRNIPTRTYIKANFTLLIAFNVISFILSTPYFLFGAKIMYLHFAMFLFNTGVNVFLLIFFASFNTKRINLMANSSFNYQGMTFKNFLIILPIMFFPMLLVSVLSIFLNYNQALLILGLIGLAGCMLIPIQINACTQMLNRRKYVMAAGFREKE